jgi:hypothetical protein
MSARQLSDAIAWVGLAVVIAGALLWSPELALAGLIAVAAAALFDYFR